MLNVVQRLLDRISTGWSFAVFGVLAVSLVLTVNLADYSWTLPGFARLTHGAGILDMERHYDADGAYRILAAQGAVGRAHYLRSIWTLDVAIPVLVSLWLAIAITLARRHTRPPARRLTQLALLPLVAGFVDLLENSAISVLLLRYPDRVDALANLAGMLTTLKHGMYTLALASAVMAWLIVLLDKAKRLLRL